MRGADKRLNEMNRLTDMLHFPVLVNAGATANVLLTIAVTRFVAPRYTAPFASLVWLALVLGLNLLPVLVLRRTLTPATPYPLLRDMDFVGDQHKFSDWVYLAASANMAFWVLTAWALFQATSSRGALPALLLLAFLATFSPVLLRRGRR